MSGRYDTLASLLGRADRRTFLKALGVMGAGAIVGGGALRAVLMRDANPPLVSRSRTAMGTFVEIHAVRAERGGRVSHALAEDAIQDAFAEMDRLIGILSRHDAGSPLSALNARGSLAGAPRELADVVEAALAAHRRTGGAFDPTVGPLVALLEASRGGPAPAPAEVREAAALVGAGRVQLSDGGTIRFQREGMRLTLDGIAKGAIVDRMSEVLAAAGVTDHLVNAGGDIRTRGERAPGRPWTIAVEDPRKQRHYPDVIRLRDGAVATSGSYENFFDDAHTRHHLVDPSTGRSPGELVSATVCAPTVMDADALATGVFVMGRARGLEVVNGIPATACLLVDVNRSWVSRRWPPTPVS
jgi:thiamine biosynthesis lipoprotein